MSPKIEKFLRLATERPPAWRGAVWFVLGLASLLLYAFAKIPTDTVRTSQNLTCLYCRAHRNVVTYQERKLDTVTETEFSAWCQLNRPPHEHRWVRTGPRIKYNILGMPLGHGCGIYHPVRNLPQQRQLEFVQSAKPEEIEAFFAGILSTNRAEQRAAVGAVLNPNSEPSPRERK